MKSQRQKFFLQRKTAYLNCAYMSPILRSVEKAGILGIKGKRHPQHLSPSDFLEPRQQVRKLFSALINNQEENRIAIIPSASYGLANVVNNIKGAPGKIIMAEEQFPSNVYPWHSLKERGFQMQHVGPTDALQRGESWNEAILSAIDQETRVVALGHVHWSDGTLFDLKRIREKLNKVGGLLIIDGTQSIGALPFDVQEIQPDALICAGYKWLMGPYSIGLAYYSKTFDDGNPIEQNWINRHNSQDFAGLVNYEESYQPKALRYDVGEHSNFILLPMLLAALKQVETWQPQAIQTYTANLMSEAIEELEEIGYQIEEKAYRANHLFGIRLPKNVEMSSLQKSLKRNRVSVSVRGSALRISPHVYNDEIDVRKLLKALKDPIFA